MPFVILATDNQKTNLVLMCEHGEGILDRFDCYLAHKVTPVWNYAADKFQAAIGKSVTFKKLWRYRSDQVQPSEGSHNAPSGFETANTVGRLLSASARRVSANQWWCHFH